MLFKASLPPPTNNKNQQNQQNSPHHTNKYPPTLPQNHHHYPQPTTQQQPTTCTIPVMKSIIVGLNTWGRNEGGKDDGKGGMIIGYTNNFGYPPTNHHQSHPRPHPTPSPQQTSNNNPIVKWACHIWHHTGPKWRGKVFFFGDDFGPILAHFGPILAKTPPHFPLPHNLNLTQPGHPY